jgi:demethylmenaquinone methyltransferase/2-methoxy-6-polyprenyl-1,4-benzoquinol methylase
MGAVDEDALISQQIEYYRGRARDYDATASPPHDPLGPYTSQIEKALARFGPTGRVLEIASGTGTWTRHLLRHAAQITALDVANEMHEQSQAKIGDHPRLRRVAADVFSWEPDGVYDVVFFANWLSHVPPGKFHGFWQTVRAALSPAGRVFVVDEIEDAWRREELLHEDFVVDPSLPIVKRALPDGRTFHVVKQFWNPEELRAALRADGWELAVHPAGPLFWAEGVPA